MLNILAVLPLCSFFSSSMAFFFSFIFTVSQSVNPVSYGFNLPFMKISTHAHCIDDDYGLLCGSPNSHVKALSTSTSECD